jgi:iron complex transport system substrate-binding protein
MLFGITLLALLAACGGAPAATGPTQAPVAPTNAPAPTSAPIVVKHTKGTLTLDKPAARVVACSEEAADFLITLGVKPVGLCSDRVAGATSGAAYELPHFFPKEQLGTPIFLGAADAPALESIVALKPDLIISGVWAEAANDKLAQIAPTFVVDTAAPGYWRETLLEVGKALGREAQAQQFLVDYDASARRLAEQLAPTAARSPNVLFIYSFAATDGTMVLGPTWTGSKAIEALGFKIVEPAGLDLSNGGVAPISPEMVGQIGADIVMVIRPKTADGKAPRYPIDDLLDSLKGPRVIRQEIDLTRGSTAPYTDKFVLEEIAGLLGAATSGAQPAGAGGTRVVRHAMGETVVPASPQRVVVLDSGELDAVVALGITPVGAFTLFEGDDFLSYLRDKLKDVQPVGTIGEPNLEAIAALKPDLILSNKTRHEKIYDQLSAIAPTVFAESVGAVWKDNFKLYAEALGKHEQGEQVIASYNARLAAFKQRMGDRLKTQVSVLRVVEDGVRIIQKRMYIGVILDDAGLARPPAQNVDDRFQLVSFEKIPEMDGDVIFVSYFGKNDAAYQRLLAQPLWKANQAVAAGNVFAVNDDVWQTGLGFTSANMVIDDLERYLAGQ